VEMAKRQRRPCRGPWQRRRTAGTPEGGARPPGGPAVKTPHFNQIPTSSNDTRVATAAGRQRPMPTNADRCWQAGTPPNSIPTTHRPVARTHSRRWLPAEDSPRPPPTCLEVTSHLHNRYTRAHGWLNGRHQQHRKAVRSGARRRAQSVCPFVELLRGRLYGRSGLYGFKRPEPWRPGVIQRLSPYRPLALRETSPTLDKRRSSLP